MPKRVRVAIFGVSGYSGAELFRLLLSHPHVKVSAVTSDRFAGKPVNEACSWLTGLSDLVCQPHDPDLASKADAVFLATPSGVSMEYAPGIVDRGKVCIDLSGDFRFADPCLYEHWYGRKHSAPKLCAQAVFGLTEFFRENVRHADLIANPGCYPTGAILGLAPLLEKGLISEAGLIIDSKSGVSGAGRRAPSGSQSGDPYGFAELDENVTAYRLTRHQHTPEIETYLGAICGRPLIVCFTPHLVPMTRGILTTAYAELARRLPAEELHRALERRYRREPFIRVLPLGQVPATKCVLGTNLCDIGVFVDDRTGRAIVVTAIDNLVKGAAGQAIQNLNVRFGLDETTGLTAAPVYP